VSYADALALDQPEMFRDKVVFVGARVLTRFAGERKDEYPTPYTFLRPETPFISGVEIQATAFLNLVRGDWWRRASNLTEAIVITLLGALFGYALMQARPWSATALALVASGAVLLASYAILRDGNLWFPWLVPVTQLAVVWVVSVAVNSFRLYLERRLYEQTLALYLSPKLVKKFMDDEKFRQPGAEKQTITILFSDIANFTSISEGMDSDDLAKLMNRYFEKAVKDAIHATDGTVVKYIGDAIFSFWNAPDQQIDHAARACDAALLFRDQGLQHAGGRPLVTRIGLHTGVANVGNFGSMERIDYTALGESVNLASRMEGLNKHLGTTVLITGATKTETGDHFSTRCLGKFRLKGFEKSVEVFELLGQKNGTAAEWLAGFDSALTAFTRGEFDAAERGFRKVLELRKEDGPTRFYLERIREVRNAPASAAWTGEVDVNEK
jgi:adenylate cyclase